MQSLEALEFLFDDISLPILALDIYGRVEKCNFAFERFFRFSTEDLRGRDANERIVTTENLAEVQDWTERARRGEEIRASTRCRSKNGKTFEIDLHLLPHRIGGEVRGVWAVFHDVSAARRLEEELRQARKMEVLGQLTGGIAHDFNNLLTVIIGYSEMLEITLEPGDLQRHAHEIRRAAERAGDLTMKLLAFGRKQDLKPANLQLNALILELQRMLQRMIGEKIHIATNLDLDLGLVHIDRVQLEQVIINLVVNSRDAMPGGGQLVIETGWAEMSEEDLEDLPSAQPGEFVLFRVRDDGCGMDDDTQTRMFDPFFTTKAAGKGTGLGLSSVYGVVSQNGGYIRVESEVGRGTTIEIGLPRISENAVPFAMDPSGRIAVGHETILVVEDDARVRRVTRDYLELSGYEVLEASSEGEALRHSEDHSGPIHLLLTDVVLPGTNGPELARKLTDLRPEMKVLFQSGYNEDEVIRQGGSGGQWGYLQKPVRQKVMTQKVRQILDS